MSDVTVSPNDARYEFRNRLGGAYITDGYGVITRSEEWKRSEQSWEVDVTQGEIGTQCR